MTAVLMQVLQLLLIAAIGFAAARLKWLKNGTAEVLSAVMVYIVQFFKCFTTFSKYCTVAYLTKYSTTLLVSCALLAVLFFVTRFMSRAVSKDSYRQQEYHCMFVVSNFGYMGFSVAEGLFGEQALMDIMMFTLPLNMLGNSYFYCTLTDQRVRVKNLLSVPVLGMLAGAAVALIGIPLPSLVTDISESIGACYAPLSMVLCGVILAEFPLASMFTNVRSYIYAVLRLLAIPLALYFATKPFLAPEMSRCVILAFAMPCGMNAIVFPKLAGHDCREGACNTLVTMLLCVLTIPLCLKITGMM